MGESVPMLKTLHQPVRASRTTGRRSANFKITVIVPAYNEAASIADTIKSIQNQTLPPDEIIIVDDCSTDGTGDLARSFGVKVVTPPSNTGSKAGAQTY